MTWITSYIGSNGALIIVVVLAVVALGAVAWFAKNWKVAVAAAIVLAAGLAYQQIDKNAYQRALNEQAAQEREILLGRLSVAQRLADNYKKRVLEDAARIDELTELVNATPPNDGPCLPKDSAERVGRIR